MAITDKNVYLVYKNLHTVIGKDVNDNFISVNEYNDLLAGTFYPFIYSKTNAFLKGEAIPIEAIQSSALLARLTYTEPVTPNAGLIDLHSGIGGELAYDYLFWVSAWTNTAYNGQRRRIKLVSTEELADINMNMAKPRPDEYPLAVLSYNVASGYYMGQVYPTDISSVKLSYIRKPTLPFLDYYIDTSYYRQYLEVGTDLTSITTGQYRDGNDMDDVATDSLTIEIDLPDSYIEEYMFVLLEKLEKRKPDYSGVQYSLAKQGQNG